VKARGDHDVARRQRDEQFVDRVDRQVDGAVGQVDAAGLQLGDQCASARG
jgi:hypothetical protein